MKLKLLSYKLLYKPSSYRSLFPNSVLFDSVSSTFKSTHTWRYNILTTACSFFDCYSKYFLSPCVTMCTHVWYTLSSTENQSHSISYWLIHHDGYFHIWLLSDFFLLSVNTLSWGDKSSFIGNKDARMTALYHEYPGRLSSKTKPSPTLPMRQNVRHQIRKCVFPLTSVKVIHYHPHCMTASRAFWRAFLHTEAK